MGQAAEATQGAPRVSVVIIFLNAAKFLEEAIESVLAQTYASWELLLVDDGSTDAGTELAKGYRDRYPQRVRYLEHAGHENRGMSASRNLGMTHAAGDLIALLDADDVWLPDKLEKQVALLERHPEVGLLAHPALYWYPDGTKKVQAMTLPAGPLAQGAWGPKMLESDDNAACPSTVLLRKDLALRLGGFEESFRGSFEDQVMWFKVTLNAAIYYDPTCLILYRIHADACCSATSSVKQLEARIRLYTWLKDYLREGRSGWRPPRSLRVLVQAKLDEALRRAGGETMKTSPGGVLGSLPTALLQPARSVARRVRGLLKVPRVAAVRGRLTLGVKPLSYLWGGDRGQPIHRYYLDRFLQQHAPDIRGHCLEFQDPAYVPRFGGAAVTKLDVLHLDASNPRATLIADLTKPNDIPTGLFDCLVCTHVLHIVYEVSKIVAEMHRILKPGGVLLVAVPHVSMYEPREQELWRFTPEGLRRVLASAFGASQVTVQAYGNSLTAAGEIRGLVVDEFTQEELDHQDERFPVEVCGRAVKWMA